MQLAQGAAWAAVASMALGLACGKGNSGGEGEGTETDTEATSDDGEKFDVLDDTNGGVCPDGGGSGGGNMNDYSVIWIANSPEGTVSKIDTVGAMELARYRTGPDNPDPSRTSVNLQGDVAVANRAGSVTKIAAAEENCSDANNDDVITTSTGPNDVLPWGEDECVIWHHDIDFPSGLSSNQGGPRGIAWDAGAGTCHQNPNLWVGWRDQPSDTVMVRKIDGGTGSLIDEVEVENWQGNWGHGTYGGAANKVGDFWGLGTLGTLIKVEGGSLAVSRWDNPDDHVLYGIALDASGNPWMAGYDGNLWKFDEASESWEDNGATGGPSRLRGLAIDENGYAWIAGNEPCGLSQFDTASLTWVQGQIDLPGCDEPVGVSIDVDGFVWLPDRGANRAFKVDPNDYSVVTVTGLMGPYTYSDMTGAALGLVVGPPQG